ncbi:MAG: protein kinase domain-containing protein [Gemmatimonadaceae bacterium]
MSTVVTALSTALAGRYRVERTLGVGGMATVYLAEDLKHHRKVAVKVLKPELAAVLGAERFVQEIATTAALQHPHILPLFDSGEADGFLYYVMPFVDGETLRAKLDRETQLGIDEAVRITTAVADALDYAHRHGVIHRDIKPENILLQEGRPMVADFGIALAVSAAAGGRMTETGLSLGTPHYMSPEQATAEKEISARSDIYSLGSVLYEMLTGDPPHTGASAQQIIMKIITEPAAPVTQARKSVPRNVAAAVAHALEKLPADRFESAKAFAEALTNPGYGPHTELARVDARGRARWTLALATGLVLGLVMGVATARLGLADRVLGVGDKANGLEGVTFRQRTFGNEAVFSARFAHDGESIVYSAVAGGVAPRLYVIRSGYPDPRPIGDSAMQLLAVSSTDELAVLLQPRYQLHRVFRGTLARMPFGGGAPREILADVRDADWNADGSGLAVVHEANGKDRVEYPIGTVLYESSGYVSDLRFSPSGDLLAFHEHPSKWDDRGAVAVVDLKGNHRILTDGYWGLEGLTWSRDGKRVIFAGALAGGFYQVHDVTRDGHARLVLPSAGTVTVQDVSPGGHWLLTRDDLFRRLMVKAPGATEERDLSWLDNSSLPSISGDGRVLAFDNEAADAGVNYAVMLRKTDGSPAVKLGEGSLRAFSRDTRWVLSVVQSPVAQLMLYPTGVGQARRIDKGELESYSAASFHPDGKRILVCGNERARAIRCYMRPLGDGPLRAVTPEGYSHGELSPDGRELYAASALNGYHVFSADNGAPRAVIGLRPSDLVVRWSPDGSSLWVRPDDEMVIRVERLELATGRRTPLLSITPSVRPGLLNADELTLADDPRAYAFMTSEQQSQVFVVEGMK